MADLALAVSSAVATVYLVAAVGKILSRSNFLDYGIAIAELVAAALLLAVPFLPLTALIVLAMSGSYFVYAWTRPPDSRCECFGAYLPASDRVVQRSRNTFLLLVSAVYLAAVLERGSVRIEIGAIVDYAGGVCVGLLAVVAPWAWRWATRSM